MLHLLSMPKVLAPPKTVRNCFTLALSVGALITLANPLVTCRTGVALPKNTTPPETGQTSMTENPTSYSSQPLYDDFSNWN
jgi:hypothetical protein